MLGGDVKGRVDGTCFENANSSRTRKELPSSLHLTMWSVEGSDTI